MDENIAAELRKALNYLRAGKTKEARPIVLQILKTNPEIDQAWYMLSFVISDREKQIYALQQVLNLNSSHDKAKSRLAKILNEPQQKVEEVAEAPTGLFKRAKQAEKVSEPVVDDWQSRLSTPEPVPEPEKVAPPIAAPTTVEKPEQTVVEEEEPEEVLGGITADSFGKYKGPKRNFAKPIKRLLFIVILLGGLGFGVLKGIEILPGLLEVFANSQPTVEDDIVDIPATETPSSGGGRVLPPTWTPTTVPSSTPEPTETTTPEATEKPTS